MITRDAFFRRALVWGLTGILMVGLVCLLEPLFRGGRFDTAAFLRRVPDVLTGLWFAFLGGCLGSFLNVVVYRAPRGMSLMGTSRCPYCKNAIAPSDNLPVLAWLRLQGACRDCGRPIAARYPVVELVVAVLVLTLAVFEIALGGVNLSIESETSISGFATNLFDPGGSGAWPLIFSLVWHAGMSILLLGMALILLDRQPMPGWLVGLGVSAIITVAICHPSTLYTVRHMPAETPVPQSLRDVLISGIAGWIVGYLLSFGGAFGTRWGFPFMFALAAGAFGWPVIVFCGVVVPLIEWLRKALGDSPEQLPLDFVAVLCFYLIAGYPLLHGYIRTMPF